MKCLKATREWLTSSGRQVIEPCVWVVEVVGLVGVGEAITKCVSHSIEHRRLFETPLQQGLRPRTPNSRSGILALFSGFKAVPAG